MLLVDLFLHRLIRTGDTILLYPDRSGNSSPTRHTVKVEGWGRYAAVRLPNGGAIRRDVIRKDAAGNWYYRYDG